MRLLARRLPLLTAVIVGSAIGGITTAIAAGSGTIDPPPRIAFVARSDNPADALAAGPVAGQLGAPLFTTPRDSLAPVAATGLADYAPELVIITGGDAAVAPAVAAAIADATGLDDADVLRAAGRDRHETAVAIVALLGEYAPAYLPVAATALGALAADTAEDAEKVGGRTADEFVLRDGSAAMTGALEAPGVTLTDRDERVLTLGYHEFVSQCSDIWYSNGGAYCTNGQVEPLKAAVRLPDGAVITELTGHFFDGTTNRAIRAVLTVDDVGPYVSANALAVATTSGSPGYVTVSDAVPDVVVDNAAKQYWVTVLPPDGSWVGSSLTVRSVQVTYEVSGLD